MKRMFDWKRDQHCFCSLIRSSFFVVKECFLIRLYRAEFVCCWNFRLVNAGNAPFCCWPRDDFAPTHRLFHPARSFRAPIFQLIDVFPPHLMLLNLSWQRGWSSVSMILNWPSINAPSQCAHTQIDFYVNEWKRQKCESKTKAMNRLLCGWWFVRSVSFSTNLIIPLWTKHRMRVNIDLSARKWNCYALFCEMDILQQLYNFLKFDQKFIAE